MTAASAPPVDLLFGRIALQLGFTSEDAIADALSLCEPSGKKLGEVLVDQGHLSDAQVEIILGVQSVRVTQKENLLFAKIAVANGFLSEAEARSILAVVRARQLEERTTPVRLQALLEESGMLTSEQVADVEAVQRRLYQRSTRENVLFGAIAIEKNLASKTAIMRGIKEQLVHPGKPLGEIMVEQRTMAAEDVSAVLGIQKRRGEDAPLIDPEKRRHEMLFGKLIVSKGFADADQVKMALRVQGMRAERGRRQALGEILVEKGVVTADQVRQVLEAQEKQLLTCPSCGTPHNVEGMEPGRTLKCKRCQSPLNVGSAPDQIVAQETITHQESILAGENSADDTALLCEILGKDIQKKITARDDSDSGDDDDDDDDDDFAPMASSSGIFEAPPEQVAKDGAASMPPARKKKKSWWSKRKKS